MERKRQLIETAAALFIENGLISVTMDELAKATGMSKKTVYKWFANKESLIAEVVAMVIEQAKNILIANANFSKDRVHEMILQKHLYEYFITLNFLFNDFTLKKYPNALHLFNEFKTFHKSVIELNLTDGIATGLYRREININNTTKIYLTAIHFFLFNRSGSSSEIYDALMLFINGIVSSEGHRLISNYTGKDNHFGGRD
jgi:AcrR family transcriptional regulator